MLKAAFAFAYKRYENYLCVLLCQVFILKGPPVLKKNYIKRFYVLRPDKIFARAEECVCVCAILSRDSLIICGLLIMNK